jgi:histidinol-phosphate aminotransferase
VKLLEPNHSQLTPQRLISDPFEQVAQVKKMINPENFLRRHIRAMEPYTPILPFDVLSEQLGIPADQIIKLDANENPYGPIPAVADALSQLSYVHIYPDPESRLLRQKIATYAGVPFENIVAGAGADEMIDLVMRLFLDPDDRILNCPPTFGMYHFDAEVNAARVVSVPRKGNFELDFKEVIAAILKYQPKILFLASPNNPDGGLLSPSMLSELLDMPIILIVDEAYIDFSSVESSVIGQVITRNNLVVLRTFSKWPGLAGLRVGFGVFPEWIMPHIWKIKQPYNVSVAGSVAAITSLKNIDQLEARTELIISERERLYKMLKDIPWLEPYPSQANFILCKVIGRKAAQIKLDLSRQGILIRYFDKPGVTDHLRISVGKPNQTDRLIEALHAF